MCTLAVVLRQSARSPLIVAANRDEDRTRPARPPYVWPGVPRFVAGRDERAGGTWMGINAQGVFAGLTNLWTGERPDPSLGSRGAVIVALLRAQNLAAARTVLATIPPRSTNPFLLLCASTDGLGFWASTADDLAPRELGAGWFALGNLPPGDPGNAKLERALSALSNLPLGATSDDAAMPLRLQAVLASHHGDRGPRESLCVHTDTNYGTVSSMILLASPDLACGRLLYAAGPPCVTPFTDESQLLGEMGRA